MYTHTQAITTATTGRFIPVPHEEWASCCGRPWGDTAGAGAKALCAAAASSTSGGGRAGGGGGRAGKKGGRGQRAGVGRSGGVVVVDVHPNQVSLFF